MLSLTIEQLLYKHEIEYRLQASGRRRKFELTRVAFLTYRGHHLLISMHFAGRFVGKIGYHIAKMIPAEIGIFAFGVLLSETMSLIYRDRIILASVKHTHR